MVVPYLLHVIAATTTQPVSKSYSVSFDITLLTPDDEPRYPDAKKMNLITSIFPPCSAISFIDLLIIVRIHDLLLAPPKPWRSRVAGLTLRITDQLPEHGGLPRMGESGRGPALNLTPP